MIFGVVGYSEEEEEEEEVEVGHFVEEGVEVDFPEVGEFGSG